MRRSDAISAVSRSAASELPRGLFQHQTYSNNYNYHEKPDVRSSSHCAADVVETSVTERAAASRPGLD
ncbi:hypothetical protein SKAU_G00331220 [Synaphobranchus kaupii]|uniref:Uncharacterized protein n=1 Tax=Synaphobranchus kaupii TaxID=118154 RepID=A0A9Q1III1_SYNKA|nr:hypothetical protein SKAU_G00331220 [Synaphobranchus kaupii]